MASRSQWFANLVGALRNRYEATVKKTETILDSQALELPAPDKVARQATTFIMVGLGTALVWGVFAKIDVVVASRGKVEPLSSSQGIQSRAGGIITSVQVREGQQVEKDQLLMQLDKKPLLSQITALSEQQKVLLKEVEVLRSARQGRFVLAGEGLSPELRNRVQERLLLYAQMTNNPTGLASTQLQRYVLFREQVRNLVLANNLRQQAVEVQLGGTAAQVSAARGRLEVEREIVGRLEPLVRQGAISRNSYLQRISGVGDLESQFTQSKTQHNLLRSSGLQVQAESQRSIFALYEGIQEQLAEIDTQIDSTIKEGQQRLIQLNSQIEQTRLNLEQQDLRSPVAGVVFDLKQNLPGVLAQPGQVLMQVVPSESLIARVQIANKDIGAVREGMPVEVRIDAFPFTEFGSIQGIVTRVGSDAIPLDQTGQITAFPVEVKLERQFLEKQGVRHPLLPGMAVTANVKVESRPPIAFVFGEIVKAFDGLRSAR